MTRWSTARRAAAAVAVAVAVPVAVGAIGVAWATGETYSARTGGTPSASVDTVAAAGHDPG